MVKFEEDLQCECLVNWENEYLDYKSLKSIILFEKDEINDTEIVSIFETFDHTVASELEKINNFYKNIVSSISQEIEDLTLNGESQEITKNFSIVPSTSNHESATTARGSEEKTSSKNSSKATELPWKHDPAQLAAYKQIFKKEQFKNYI